MGLERRELEVEDLVDVGGELRVIGCVLEEYATVSTDMVDRLHDQNLGKTIPSDFNRRNAEATLREVGSPPQHRMVRGFGERQIEGIEPVAVQGGERILLCDSFVRAARYAIQPGSQTALERDDDRAVRWREHAEADEQNGEPKGQYHQQRDGHRVVCLLELQPAHLAQV